MHCTYLIKLWRMPITQNFKLNNLSRLDYRLFKKYLYVLNIDISINDVCRTHSRNVFFKFIREFICLKEHCSSGIQIQWNTRRSPGVGFVRITLKAEHSLVNQHGLQVRDSDHLSSLKRLDDRSSLNAGKWTWNSCTRSNYYYYWFIIIIINRNMWQKLKI